MSASDLIHSIRGLGVVFLLVTTAASMSVNAASRSLCVEVRPRFTGAPLMFDVLTNSNAAGQRLSITRLDFLLSNFALRRADEEWQRLSNQFAYLSCREGRTRFTLANIPAGGFDRIRFQVGVPEKENHADPSGLAASHALNLNLNDLHWSWQGGYVFLALEGNWLTAEGRQRGYSYHIATDPLLMTVELPLSPALSADSELRLALQVDEIFAGRLPFRITEELASTHSRIGDPLAAQLRENIEHAFAVESIGVEPFKQMGTSTPIRLEIAATATPYRLTLPSFFPRPELPLDNPLTEEGVELGRRLFHDLRLSRNNRQSCASCHHAESAFTEARRYSAGADGVTGHRNAMPLLNLAWKSAFFWDGRAATLREQVLQPIENPVEMHETLTGVVVKLAHPTNDYPSQFARTFGAPEITTDRIARALEQFLFVQVSHRSKFDRSLAGAVELNEQEKRGFELFHTEYDPRRGQLGADCFHCHGGPLFQNQGFANNGLDVVLTDLGRYEATRKDGDKGKFAVPSLRNVAITTPYMHDGRFATLEEVIEHYSSGVKPSPTLDPNLAKHPEGGVPLSPEDKRALVAFLKTLTDERFLASPTQLSRTP